MIEPVRGRDAFERLRREGRRVRQGPVWITFVAQPEAAAPSVSFAIGRRVGNAVRRNRLRRRLRHLLAGNADLLPPGLYLIGVQPAATQLTYQELTENVTRALRTLREAT